MDQPQPDQRAAELNIAFNAGQGPDGKQWGVMAVSSGPLTVQIAFPPEALDAISEGIPAEFTKLAAHVRRANMGLVIAPNLNGVKPK